MVHRAGGEDIRQAGAKERDMGEAWVAHPRNGGLHSGPFQQHLDGIGVGLSNVPGRMQR